MQGHLHDNGHQQNEDDVHMTSILVASLREVLTEGLLKL